MKPHANMNIRTPLQVRTPQIDNPAVTNRIHHYLAPARNILAFCRKMAKFDRRMGLTGTHKLMFDQMRFSLED